MAFRPASSRKAPLTVLYGVTHRCPNKTSFGYLSLFGLSQWVLIGCERAKIVSVVVEGNDHRPVARR